MHTRRPNHRFVDVVSSRNFLDVWLALLKHFNLFLTCGWNPTPGPGILDCLVPGLKPNTEIRPALGFSLPNMHRKIEVLPQPLGPSKPQLRKEKAHFSNKNLVRCCHSKWLETPSSHDNSRITGRSYLVSKYLVSGTYIVPFAMFMFILLSVGLALRPY